LDGTQLSAAGPRRGIANDRHTRDRRSHLLEKLQPFGADAELELGKAGGITLRAGQARNQPGANRIRDIHEDNRQRYGSPFALPR